jgi:hypothetical protein
MQLMALAGSGRGHPGAGEADGRANGQAAGTDISNYRLLTDMPRRGERHLGSPFVMVGLDEGLKRGQR